MNPTQRSLWSELLRNALRASGWGEPVMCWRQPTEVCLRPVSFCLSYVKCWDQEESNDSPPEAA